jgi:hypothetical protein
MGRLGNLEFFTGLLALFTAVLAVSTGLQVWAFVQSERASIAPVAAGIDPVKITTGPIVVYVQIKNSGKDTALIQESIPNYKILDRLPKFPNYGVVARVSRAILLPGQTLSTGGIAKVDGKPVMVTEDDVRSINNGEKFLWIYGKVVYRDRFSVIFGPQIIGYCFEYNPANDFRLGMFNGCGEENYVYTD